MLFWNGAGKLGRTAPIITVCMVLLTAVLLVLVLPGSRPISMEGGSGGSVD